MSSCLRRPGEEEGSPAQRAGTWTEGHPTILAPPGGPRPGSSWDTVGGMLKGSGPRQGDKPGLLSRRTRSVAGSRKRLCAPRRASAEAGADQPGSSVRMGLEARQTVSQLNAVRKVPRV